RSLAARRVEVQLEVRKAGRARLAASGAGTQLVQAGAVLPQAACDLGEREPGALAAAHPPAGRLGVQDCGVRGHSSRPPRNILKSNSNFNSAPGGGRAAAQAARMSPCPKRST